MRITRLDLLRYGKFTDKSVAFPSASKDFHLIVGPNEAGKSTLRNAIQDLLFGIETRSRYNFLHQHSDMRLGALIENGSDRLDFVRLKARTKTLQTPTESTLPDNALTPFLGQVDRDFFDQMFGLNHERLVKGGQEILSASNDIGQILFQAAAGIGSLGEVRERLEAEAEKLWSKRKSGEREYYIASQELELAETALKQATVRTKDWQQAQNDVDRISEALKLAKQRFQGLEQERIRLERVRRAARIITTLGELERQLNQLGTVISLPENAGEQLASAQNEIAISTRSLEVHQAQAVDLQQQLSAIEPNELILAHRDDIEALSELRQQLRKHDSDIGKREDEIRTLWQSVYELARQLGWPAQDEQSTSQRLPGSLVRAAIDSLLRRHEALAQALSTAEESLSSRLEEINSITAEIDALPADQVSVTLVDALSKARALGDIATHERQLDAQVSRLKRELETATSALGKWNAEPDALLKLAPPTQDEIQSLIRRRNDLELATKTIKERIAEVSSEIQGLELDISQYRTTHQPVTLADVQKMRASRDASWHSIKTGVTILAEAAPNFEKQIIDSDSLSDKRHDKAQEETQLQSLLNQLQKSQQQLAIYEKRLSDNTDALNHFDREWTARTQECGLPGMKLLQINDWRAYRERVLDVAANLAEAESTRQAFVMSVTKARDDLRKAAHGIKPDVAALDLPALVLFADGLVSTDARARERREALTSQKIRAEAAIPDLKKKAAQARSSLDAWREDLHKNLKLAHLPVDASIGSIEAALALFADMEQHLQKIRDIQANRVDMMRRDLEDFADAASSLAQAIAPEIIKMTPAEIAVELFRRLEHESAALQEQARLTSELEKVSQQVNITKSKIASAKAVLDPLFRLSDAADYDALRAAIQKSDCHRSLSAEVSQSIKLLLQAGDGLGRDALETESSSIDVNNIPIRLSEIMQEIEEVISEQNRLSGERISAEVLLGKIAGQADAAQAESQRQEALARMGNAVERFIKVHTAAKLLRWSIERFRESKQGPMLLRANHIFSGLTQGAFNKLVVDYDSDPFRLFGQRATGELVEIDGMSEGTRDQLYLALRLAALELHLAQTIPLPFIADDLFINYDDGRAKAGLEALAELSAMTQVIFLTHHEHLVPLAQDVFRHQLNVVALN